jgi:hypothetical protein
VQPYKDRKLNPLFPNFAVDKTGESSTPKSKQTSPQYLVHHPLNNIYITSTSRKYDDERNSSTSRSLSNDLTREVEGMVKTLEKPKDDAKVSTKVMEQHNEVFRSTYYLSQTKTTKTPTTPQHIPVINKDLHLSNSYYPYHHRDSRYTISQERLYRHKSTSEKFLYEKSHHSSSPSSDFPGKTTLYQSSVHRSTFSTPIEIRKQYVNSRKRHHRRFTSSHRQNSNAHLISIENDKYNSDFYTKLPPKLHIVESQNENGVTLTWNTTSKCDISLVKSYQLFARELFGHKVGTMKRIGVVNALPLPMSCNVDKLKYHIKYKFAVCAIDIYGRYGKMSNFTGKFELKQK